jgi:hypothetical protein
LLLEGQKRGLLKLEPDEKSGGLGRERRNFDELDAELVDENAGAPRFECRGLFLFGGSLFCGDGLALPLRVSSSLALFLRGVFVRCLRGFVTHDVLSFV